MKLLIKLLCNFLIFCGGVTVFASTDNKPSSNIFSNGRIGVGIAGEYASIDASLKIRSPIQLGNISSSQHQTCKKFQVAPSLELGTTIMGDYYLGFVANWRSSRANTTATTPLRGAYHFEHQFKLQSYTDAFVKLGYRATRRTMFYGVIGPSIANWSHTTQQISVNGVTQVSKLIDTFEMKEKTVGLGLGAGVEYLIKNKYALSFEYVFHTHHSRSASHTISYVDFGPRTRTGDLLKIVRPSYSTFAIRLTYFFSLF